MARADRASMKSFLPWVEKYRPTNIDEVAHQSHVVDTLRKGLNDANLSHLLFHGPPGTGKTSTILALARQLYGPRLMKERVLELNASDERGINVVRSKIKSFAQFAVSASHKEPNYPCPPYKIIILDEADSMTRDAQTALRRTMERYSKVTRFCLICNYVSRIIAPVASRCAKFRFQPLSSQSMAVKLQEVAGREELMLQEDTIEEILAVSQGDMRKAITLLQSAALLKDRGEEITVRDVQTVSVRVPESEITALVEACSQQTFDEINGAVTYLSQEGYPVSLVLEQLLHRVIVSDVFSNVGKANISIRVAEADANLCDGASEFLQLLDVCSCVSQNVEKNQ